MTDKPRYLIVRKSQDTLPGFLAGEHNDVEFDFIENPMRALVAITREKYAGVYVDESLLDSILELGRMAQTNQIVEGMPDGVVLVDKNNRILWGNTRVKEWCRVDDIIGTNFYTALGSPEILGPDFCPFHSAAATGKPSGSTLRNSDNKYFQVHCAPVLETNGPTQLLVVTVRDVTEAMHQQHKLNAIHQAGMQLADLTPDELLQMAVEDRIELLKSNILHCTQDILNYNVVELRLLAPETSQLEPLLAVGMDEEAITRELYASPHDNGITGFVGATGKSYLCEDTNEDPLFLPGLKNAKSSLTVPLILHDRVIGTFNVESPEPRAFNESDLQFLEIFTRDVAVALNTLELLVAEKASSAAASVEAIHREVALPVDEILNDVFHVFEHYIGHDPELVERLQRILQNARDIKQVIQKVGQKMTPTQALPSPPEESSELLRGYRVLVADEDSTVRSQAHDLLDRYGCTVETAPTGALALFMARYSGYDAVIADIRLPDMPGYLFMERLQEVLQISPLPLIMMTGAGWDRHHSIVKGRQAGLKHFLYKPFRLDQLLNAVQEVVKTQTEPYTATPQQLKPSGNEEENSNQSQQASDS